jgi:hypothetical protein
MGVGVSSRTRLLEYMLVSSGLVLFWAEDEHEELLERDF